MTQYKIYKYRTGVSKWILFCGLLSLLFLNLSCNDWLDISPKEDRKKDEIFSKPEGFRNVLIGAYIRMKSNDLYGKEMVCGTIENLAQHWDFSKDDIGAYLNEYDYKAIKVEKTMADIYNNLFKVIADVNGLLSSVDNGVLIKKDYELIKGEALALRAFCHFDVLRLFGPMPIDTNSDKILPYVKKITNRPNPFLTYEEFTKELLGDIDEAITCMKNDDPILSISIEDLSTPSKLTDDFWGYRQMRMNYYAVCALKARVALWINDKPTAMEYARIVIDAKTPTGDNMFRLGTTDDCSRGDKILSSEHIFNLKVNDISTSIGSGKTYKKTQSQLTSQLYEQGTTDIRFVNMWNNEYDSNLWTYNNYFVKYVQSEKMLDLAKNVIPIIRLYEMYLIALECETLDNANTLYQKMCTTRNAPFVQFTSQEQLTDLLIKEYNKEFYGEGQAFYAYKRLGAKKIFFTNEEGSKDTYVIPLPKQESTYAN